MTRKDLINLIENGRLDSVLRELNSAIIKRLRKIQLEERADKAKRLRKEGTRVVCGPHARPRYFVGMKGKVIPARAPNKPRPGWLWVILDEHPRSRSRRWSQVIHIPADVLEKETK